MATAPYYDFAIDVPFVSMRKLTMKALGVTAIHTTVDSLYYDCPGQFLCTFFS
jgi:hypothetical protein